MLNPPIWLFGLVGLIFALVFAYLAVAVYTDDIEGSLAYGIMAIAALVASYSLISELKKEPST